MEAPVPNAAAVDDGTVAAIVSGEHGDPFAVLGMHEAPGGYGAPVVRPGYRIGVPSAAAIASCSIPMPANTPGAVSAMGEASRRSLYRGMTGPIRWR